MWLMFALAILIIYLTGQLKFSDSNATAIYHMFVFVAYFSPLFGAILADGHIGKYRYFINSFYKTSIICSSRGCL